MPNWVHTVVKFYGKDKQSAMESILNDEGCVDFEKVIPMPESIYRGPVGEAEMKQYGENNWYDWSRKNWGTKWNACESQTYRDEARVVFETAWSLAYPVLRKLSEKFPNTKMVVWYADEDIGNNCGKVTFLGGEEIEYSYYGEWDDQKSRRFARSVWNR
jgi:hypothetical protein